LSIRHKINEVYPHIPTTTKHINKVVEQGYLKNFIHLNFDTQIITLVKIEKNKINWKNIKFEDIYK